MSTVPVPGRRSGENIFSELKNADVGSTGRKVWHSLRDRLNVAFGGSGTDMAVTGATYAANTVGIAGSAVGFAGGVVAILGTTGAIAALAGPQAAITLGVLGLVATIATICLMAKDAYSDRESAHKVLSDYCWNLVDQAPPIIKLDENSIDKAVKAAMTLVDDGKSQIERLHEKFNIAKVNVDIFNKKSGDLFASFVNSVNTTTHAQQEAKVKELVDFWEAALKPNGAIFELVRRCVHAANYLQAYHIIDLNVRYKLAPKSDFKPIEHFFVHDFFKHSKMREESAALFKALEETHTMFLMAIRHVRHSGGRHRR